MPPQNASAVPIVLQFFCDLELELSGWYALGHHDPTEFLNAVLARGSKAKFLPPNVQQGWAAFRTDGFDFVTRALPNFQPITVIAWSENSFIDA